MTVGTTNGRKFTINELIVMASRKAGLLEVSQGIGNLSVAQQTSARDTLQTIIDDLETEGVFARWVQFYDLPLVADDYRYDLPTYVLDLVGDGMWIDPSTVDLTKASGESLVVSISKDAWHRTSDKSATGLPTRMYLHRELDVLELRLWPIPDAASAGWIRLQVQRNFADVTDGNATVDLETYWSTYLIHELASQLAEDGSMPDGKIRRLSEKAGGSFKKAKAKSVQTMNNQVVVGHRTGWSGR